MPLDKDRLKQKLKAIMEAEAANETDPALARDRFADKMATAFIEEIKNIKITLSPGMVAGNVPVTGVFNYIIS